MIISKTPLRIGLVGGGSDMDDFAARHGGAVISMTIDKYVYVVVNERFEDGIRISHSETETVGTLDEVRHGLAREAMRISGVEHRVEIATMAHVPSTGTGLGASSAVTVGLLNALLRYGQKPAGAARLADLAAKIELQILGRPIGRQDHYSAAFGGLQLLRFRPDGQVERHPLTAVQPAIRDALQESLVLVYTGERVDPTDGDRNWADDQMEPVLLGLRDLALRFADEISHGAGAEAIADYLNRGWELKRRLPGVSSPALDDLYGRARDAGARGAKLLGWGGGGFLLCYVPGEQRQREAFLERLGQPRRLSFSLEDEGSRIVADGL